MHCLQYRREVTMDSPLRAHLIIQAVVCKRWKEEDQAAAKDFNDFEFHFSIIIIAASSHPVLDYAIIP